MTRPLPLAPYTVLDLTVARAGPTAVRLLSDWGAKVIRVEPPVTDNSDKSGSSSTKSDVTGKRHGPDFQNLHRNKQSLSLDLKSTKGKDIFFELVKRADILIENFRVDVKQRLGIDYDSLKVINPALIYGSISGFGQDGPYRDRPGVDQIIQGSSGLMSITGEPDQGPMRVGIAVSDTSAGMFLGQGILLALLHREHTGEGQWVHTSLIEAMLSKLDFQGARYTMDGEVPTREGNNHPTNSPMGVFDASDGQINMAASTDKMFRAFCHEMNALHLLNNPNYTGPKNRLQYRHQLWQEVNQITSQYSTKDLVERLNPVGVPCGPINTIAEAFEDEQVQFLKMQKIAHHPTLGDLSLVRTPINSSLFPEKPEFDSAAPELGEHNASILATLGYTDEQIAALASEGVI